MEGRKNRFYVAVVVVELIQLKIFEHISHNSFFIKKNCVFGAQNIQQIRTKEMNSSV